MQPRPPLEFDQWQWRFKKCGITLKRYGIYFTWSTGGISRIYHTLLWQICTVSRLYTMGLCITISEHIHLKLINQSLVPFVGQVMHLHTQIRTDNNSGPVLWYCDSTHHTDKQSIMYSMIVWFTQIIWAKHFERCALKCQWQILCKLWLHGTQWNLNDTYILCWSMPI